MPVLYASSQYGDHSPGECEAMRQTYSIEGARRKPDPDIMAFAIGGYHAGWGICAGKVGAPTTFRARVDRPVSPFTRRALAGQLPAKAVR